MPELPEVETTRRGLLPHLLNQSILRFRVREPRLRWRVPEILETLTEHKIYAIERRAKYLLFRCDLGTHLVHLGMSGSLRISNTDTPLRTHDHIIATLSEGRELRYHDPRRFGAWLWLTNDPLKHPLLRDLGPEPLEAEFTGDYLYTRCKSRKSSIKSVIMDAHTVVGVGNIYACEALFLAGIAPTRAAAKVTRKRIDLLVSTIRQVLSESIAQGGTTLRDYVREDGTPGYFKLKLRVYGREGAPCLTCDTPIQRTVIAQRSTFFCPSCQR